MVVLVVEVVACGPLERGQTEGHWMCVKTRGDMDKVVRGGGGVRTTRRQNLLAYTLRPALEQAKTYKRPAPVWPAARLFIGRAAHDSSLNGDAADGVFICMLYSGVYAKPLTSITPYPMLFKPKLIVQVLPTRHDVLHQSC